MAKPSQSPLHVPLLLRQFRLALRQLAGTPGDLFFALGDGFAPRGQFPLLLGQRLAARGQVGFVLVDPKSGGPCVGLQAGDARVQLGLAVVQFLLPIAKVCGQLGGLQADLFADRLVGNELRRRHRLVGSGSRAESAGSWGASTRVMAGKLPLPIEAASRERPASGDRTTSGFVIS